MYSTIKKLADCVLVYLSVLVVLVVVVVLVVLIVVVISSVFPAAD